MDMNSDSPDRSASCGLFSDSGKPATPPTSRHMRKPLNVQKNRL
jgi:hypothetical protein